MLCQNFASSEINLESGAYITYRGKVLKNYAVRHMFSKGQIELLSWATILYSMHLPGSKSYWIK